MRQIDRIIFSDASKTLNLWILVMQTNSAAYGRIGKARYKPKRNDCKAKAAVSNGDTGYELKGLVTNPFIHPTAFKLHELETCKMRWKRTEYLIGSIYSVDVQRESKHFGCLMLKGNYIHSDYDLYDIIDPEQKRRTLGLVGSLNSVGHIEGPNTRKVMDYINPRIGTPMIQHGEEVLNLSEPNPSKIDAFGPDGEEISIIDEGELKKMYETMFEGRRRLTDPHFR